MILEASSRFSGSQIPQAESLVPASAESVVSVGRQDDVRDEVAVAIETLLGNSIAVGFTQQAPDDESLVS